jgi:small nuclear ribonucleoprotein (snRNP)-like protein
MMHHGPDTQRVAEFLGYVVKFALTDGSVIEGRIEAVDHANVYLTRTRHKTVALHDIKEIVNPPF